MLCDVCLKHKAVILPNFVYPRRSHWGSSPEGLFHSLPCMLSLRELWSAEAERCLTAAGNVDSCHSFSGVPWYRCLTCLEWPHPLCPMVAYWLGPWKELVSGSRRLGTPTGLIICCWSQGDALTFRQRAPRGTAWRRTGPVSNSVPLQRVLCADALSGSVWFISSLGAEHFPEAWCLP